MTRTLGRRHALVVGLVALLALAGCGVRLDTPPPEVPAADATEQVRQASAQASAELHAAARAARAAAPEDAALGAVLTAVETAATEHHAALGGVWEPWPGAGPDATAYPGPDGDPTTPTPGDSADPQAVLSLLEEAAAAARDEALTQSGDLGQVLASVAISRSLHAADLGEVLSVPAESLPSAPLPVPEPGTVDPHTSRAVDAARYAFEVVAARSSGDQRSTAVGRAAHLEEVAGAVAPEEDLRDVAYDVTGAGETTTPEHDLAAAAELDVLRAYVTLLATDGGDREAVLSAAAHAAQQVRSWDGSLPPLPGLA